MSEGPKKLLSLLLVIGAQSPDKAINLGELALKLGTDKKSAEAEVRQLAQSGYVAKAGALGNEAFYLTGTGVIAASSTYS